MSWVAPIVPIVPMQPVQPAVRGPRLTQVTLRVERCGEDPVRDSAWLVGRRRDGAGLLCLWPGQVPDGVGEGAIVRATGRPVRPRGPTNPGERDRAAPLQRAGVHARIYLGDRSNLEIMERGGSMSADEAERFAEIERAPSSPLGV